MQYATQILTTEENYSADARVKLAQANASPYPFCSDAELAWLRLLLFKSEYVHDIGHMRNGRILCSAVLGREGVTEQQFKPDFVRWDGSKVYYNIAPLPHESMHTASLQLGDSFMVYNPFNVRLLDSPVMHRTLKLFDVPNPVNGPLGTSANDVDPSIPARDGQYRHHDFFFAVRCSTRFFNCVTTYNSMKEIMAYYRVHLIAATDFGGLIGGCFGLLASFLYRRNRSMAHQLQRAIRNDKLRLVYQPIIDLASKRIIGAEALSRWTDEDGIIIPPDVFVKVAEQLGFVGSLTRLVVRHAFSDFANTLRAHPDFRLSINVTAADLGDRRFLPMLKKSLDEAGVSAKSLAIEITESSTAHYDMAIAAISHLRRQGHSIHIDDFGTGYSSLSYLHDLSVDTIKIDKIFTRSVGTQAVTAGILPQILAMAETLNLQVIVEGIETSEQAEYFAKQARPILGQGWLFGRAVTSEEFHRLLDEDEKRVQAATASL
jgi:sensor c-di-GMP phosphodiesterase-like protein